ncbi:MAG: serine hydrolase [Minisyncoccia bacterium]
MDTRRNRIQQEAKRARALFFVLASGVTLALLMQGLLSFILENEANTKRGEETGEIRTLKTTKMESPFESLSLEAHAAYVYELKTGVVLFAKNENEKLPLASVTKLMTALVAREAWKESAVVVLTKDDLSTEGDSGLLSGERWRLGDLLNVMLLISSNDAAHAVAAFVGAGSLQKSTLDEAHSARDAFVGMMNTKAKELNLAQMEFFNESGLDMSPAQNGGYGSAQNVAQLFAELWKKYPETIEITAHKDTRIFSQDKTAHYLPNTNEIVGHIPGLIASKTGFTNISGGNLTVIFDRGIGDPVVVVVLGSSYKGRFDDMQKLVSTAKNMHASGEPF